MRVVFVSRWQYAVLIGGTALGAFWTAFAVALWVTGHLR